MAGDKKTTRMGRLAPWCRGVGHTWLLFGVSALATLSAKDYVLGSLFSVLFLIALVAKIGYLTLSKEERRAQRDSSTLY